MKKKSWAIAALLLVSSAAIAGFKQPVPVTVDLDIRTAFGDTTTAANSDNEVELIGCGSRSIATGGGTFRFGFCQATDAAGTTIQCFTQDASLIDEMRAASDRSFITFSWQDDGGGGFECIRVGFSNQSFYLTKLKK